MTLRLLFVFALTACARQGQMPARSLPNPPAPDIYHLCSDARFQSMCTPAPEADRQQIDTNLLGPRALLSSAG